MDNKTKKQYAEQAPPPAFLKSVLTQSKKEPEMTPGENRDRVMAEFAKSDAWKILRKYMEAKLVMLAKQLRDNSQDSGLEEIGFRFLVADQVNAFTQQIINYVETVPKVMEAQNERRDTGTGGNSKK